MSKGGMAAEEDCAVRSVPGLEITLWALVLLSARDGGLRARPMAAVPPTGALADPGPCCCGSPGLPAGAECCCQRGSPWAQRAGWARAGTACPRRRRALAKLAAAAMSAPCPRLVPLCKTSQRFVHLAMAVQSVAVARAALALACAGLLPAVCAAFGHWRANTVIFSET